MPIRLTTISRKMRSHDERHDARARFLETL
jgi:hypothetical protein